MTCPMMMSLGVYVLGAADAGERARVESHLLDCRACQAELIHLAPLPGLLASVPDTARPGGQRPGRPAPYRNRGIQRWRAVAAAACLAAGAGLGVGFLLARTYGAHQPASFTLSGVNPATHVTATAALTVTSWGTSIELNLRGAPLKVQCRLIVHSRSGITEVAGVWDAWRDGPISVPASVGWWPSNITSLQVATAAKTLLTISPHHPQGT
jgi:Putative zinc-finger